MLLYLTTNKNSALIDGIRKETNLAVKKLVGKFNLKNFIIKEIRNYTAVKYLVVDVSCAEDSISDFSIALQSFQMMFSAKIIVILSDIKNKGEYIERLSALGITNLVTEETAEGVIGRLKDILCDKPKSTITEEPKKLIWNAKNVKIAVAGVQRRSGTTVTAFNLAYWLANNGASVCYVEENINRHLRLILRMYEATAVKDHYTTGGIDFYYTDDLDRKYNFIIYDCGALTVISDTFREADKRLICGGSLPYELAQYQRALSLCKGLSVLKIAVGVPDDMQEYCTNLLGTELHFAEPVHMLFNDKANETIYNEVTAEYKE